MTGLATAPRRLGVITIGQTPRPDLQAVFAAAAPGVDVVVDGALDTCRPGELTALATEGPYPLLVRLADGSTREVPRDRLVPYVAQAAGRLAAGGATLVVLACAGEFPALACPVPLVVPGRVVPAAVRRRAHRAPAVRGERREVGGLRVWQRHHHGDGQQQRHRSRDDQLCRAGDAQVEPVHDGAHRDDRDGRDQGDL